jgi:hypothetical protein
VFAAHHVGGMLGRRLFPRRCHLALCSFTPFTTTGMRLFVTEYFGITMVCQQGPARIYPHYCLCVQQCNNHRQYRLSRKKMHIYSNGVYKYLVVCAYTHSKHLPLSVVSVSGYTQSGLVHHYSIIRSNPSVIMTLEP